MLPTRQILTLVMLFGSQSAATSLNRRIFVSGAGGQTGGAVFRKLLSRPGVEPVGVVRTQASKAKLVDTGIPAGSVFVVDVTDRDAVSSVMDGCDAAVICTSAKPAPTGETNPETGRPVFGFPDGQPEQVDWIGQKNQIDAAAAQPGKMCHVVICSSMGGTDPSNMLNALGRSDLPNGTTQGGDILLWKRKAEMYLIASGLPYTIVHPGGLVNEDGGVRELVLGVDDSQAGAESRTVPREDVAEVLVQALSCTDYVGRSFDLRAKPEKDGLPTTDFQALIQTLEGRNCDYSLGRAA